MERQSRIEAEREFHDRKAEGLVENQDFYRLDITRDVRREILREIERSPGKKTLDFGSGSGWMSMVLAGIGCEVVGIDLSGRLLSKAKAEVREKGYESRIAFCQMNGEQLAIKDDSFDIVIGNSILHHMDVAAAIGQIHRVLKPGGRAFFVEPLGYNPLINLYRRFTPHKRTVDEKPFAEEEIALMRRSFRQSRIEYHFLLSLLSFFWSFVIKSDAMFLRSLSLLQRVDRWILRACPCLRKYCWLGSFRLEK